MYQYSLIYKSSKNMNNYYSISLFLIIYLIFATCSNNYKRKIKFHPKLNIGFESYTFKSNQFSFVIPPDMDGSKIITNFTFCFRYSLDYLTKQSIFSSPFLSFKINNPLKGYGFLTLNEEYSYLLQFKPLDPATWHSVCIVKSPWNDGNGSHLIVYHDSEIILSKKIPDQAFNFIVSDFYTIKYGVDYAMYESVDIEDSIFAGALTDIMAISKDVSLKDAFSFMNDYIMPHTADVLNGENLKMQFLDENPSINPVHILASSISTKLKKTTIPIKRPMDKSSAELSCNLIGGKLSLIVISHVKEFTWTSFSKNDSLVNPAEVGLKSKDIAIERNAFFKWDVGQPDGDMEQECVAYIPRYELFHDVECSQNFLFNCETNLYTLFTLRGICEENFEIESKYYFDAWTQEYTFVFHGFKENKIFLKNKRWIIISRFQPNKILAFYNGSKAFPVGVNPWYVTGYCGGDHKFEEKLDLKLSKCHDNEFTCNNGDCIPLDRICNNFGDCSDESDEKYCSNIEAKNYRKEFPPSLSYHNKKLLIKVQLTLFAITAIKELEDVLTIYFSIRLDWKDPRLNFMRLNVDKPSILTEKEKASIWIPMISFLNSAGSITSLFVDRLAEVSIHRHPQAKGKISPTSTISEALTFNGNEAKIRYKRAFEFPIHCKFAFGFYPFDTQICKIEVSLSSRDQRKASLDQLNGTKSIQAIYKDIDILQFYIYDMYTELVGSKEQKFVAYIVFKRLFTNIFTTTYVPTFCLQIVALLTLFISEDRFDTTVNVTLTATLVMYTLYQSVSSSLPSTAYNKMIDYWLIFSLIMPFVVFVLEVLIELLNQSQESEPSQLKLQFKVFLAKFGKTLIIGTTIIFDVSYWVYNLVTYNSVSYLK